jgi:hypothetical protein
MRSIPAALLARLDGGVTTHSQACELTRRDGEVMRFTDHELSAFAAAAIPNIPLVEITP